MAQDKFLFFQNFILQSFSVPIFVQIRASPRIFLLFTKETFTNFLCTCHAYIRQGIGFLRHLCGNSEIFEMPDNSRLDEVTRLPKFSMIFSIRFRSILLYYKSCKFMKFTVSVKYIFEIESLKLHREEIDVNLLLSVYE